MMIPVILSGGSGTRLWPLSRMRYPKQFLRLLSDQSLLQKTVLRADQLLGVSSPILISNEEHRFLLAEQLREINVKPNAILLEPLGRNTAPAVTVAALHATSAGADPLLLVLPSDHLLSPQALFQEAVETAMPAALEGGLITFGVTPTRPETGYGYIRAGGVRPDGSARPVAEFVEKPVLDKAETYVHSGDYFWNSGIFLLRASSWLREVGLWAPDILEASTSAYQNASSDLDFVRLEREAFSRCPSSSVDYAVMEHTQQGLVVPLTAHWSDIGSWTSLWEVSDQDASGNSVIGDVDLQQSEGCLVRAETRLVAGLGLRDLVIVETPDAVLVAAKQCIQDVKKVVDALQGSSRSEAVEHRKIYRPWGSYDSVDTGTRFQVKRITVNPGQRLSLQMHHHRAEHWVVVKGTAKVTCGDQVKLLTEDQSTYIPVGELHRLENPGQIPLELIEVQSGSYLGEDDIVRFDDAYGRQQDNDHE
jgi:mannose-1-phosphate guanylyltransferase/mannose-6-phosphate isomerase